MLWDAEEQNAVAALAHLTRLMGIYWAVYACSGHPVYTSAPVPAPPCLGRKTCRLLSESGTCSGAVVQEAAMPEPSILVVCQADPYQQPNLALVHSLKQALQIVCRQEADAQATLRELTATYQELASAYGMMEALNQPGTQQRIAQEAIAYVKSSVQAAGVCLIHCDEQNEPQTLAQEGMSAAEIGSIWTRLVQYPVNLPEPEQFIVFSCQDKQILVSGLSENNQWTFALAIARHLSQSFTAREAKLLQAVVRQASLALHNRHLMEDLRELFYNTIEALVAAIEVKDPYTCGHSRRVAQWAADTARQYGMAEKDISDIYIAAIVHDVGKIAVEKTILCKPGKLTPEEWAAIRVHPDCGAEIIHRIPQLRHIVPSIRYHHERYDGRGYPLGLSGEAVPLASQIIAVCDSYDAMTSERPYRASLSSAAAVDELWRNAGAQWPVEIVEAFVSAWEKPEEEALP